MAQPFSASVAPLVSRPKYMKPLHRQGFFVTGTTALSEHRTAGFSTQKHKVPSRSGIFILGTTGLSERRTADIPIRAH